MERTAALAFLSESGTSKVTPSDHAGLSSSPDDSVPPFSICPRSPFHRSEATASDNYANVRLIRAIIGGHQNDLQIARAEVMAFMRWLKVFAEALIPPPTDADSDGGNNEEAITR